MFHRDGAAVFQKFLRRFQRNGLREQKLSHRPVISHFFAALIFHHNYTSGVKPHGAPGGGWGMGVED